MKRALALAEEMLGPNDAEMVNFVTNLGAIYLRQGRHADAKPLYERALTIASQNGGALNANYATALNNMADLYEQTGQLTGAIADLKNTLTEAKSEAGEKDGEIARLKKLQRRVEDETIELYGHRYRKRKDGKQGGAGNPFCDVCFQKEGLLIETATIAGKGIMALQCPNCNGRYDGLRTYTD